MMTNVGRRHKKTTTLSDGGDSGLNWLLYPQKWRLLTEGSTGREERVLPLSTHLLWDNGEGAGPHSDILRIYSWLRDQS